jgi:hypothetical protein
MADDDIFTHTNPDVDVHAMGEVHEHPTWKEYKWVALILTLITVVEVWIYYTPFSKTPFFVPVLLVMSVAKFSRRDVPHAPHTTTSCSARYSTGPLTIAMATLISQPSVQFGGK